MQFYRKYGHHYMTNISKNTINYKNNKDCKMLKSISHLERLNQRKLSHNCFANSSLEDSHCTSHH